MKFSTSLMLIATVLLFIPMNTSAMAPNAPSDLVAKKLRGNIKAVLLTWIDNSTDEQGFEIWKSENGGPFIFKGRVPTDYVIFQDNLTQQKNSYKYMVRSMNNCDQTWTFCDFSDFSNVAAPW